MNPRAYPVKFEICDHDEAGQPDELAAVVEMRDGASASVEIKTAVNATEWAALAGAIGSALSKMELQGDKP